MIGRIILAILFIVAGCMHFLIPPTYLKIVPPFLPAPRILVQLSGAAEILGGLGLLLPSTRQAAAWGLVALLIAIFPANIYMVVNHTRFASIPLWALWLRLPFQLPLIYWAWYYTARR
jgi:uncharacterized membrane protein